MWALCCKWLCSNKKSVEIEDTLTEFKRASPVSNSLTSPALMDCPKESYLGRGKRVLGSSIEKQSSEGFLGTISGGSAITTRFNPPGVALHDPHYSLSKDRDLQNYLHRNRAMYDRDSGQEELGKQPDQRRNDGFMFPILSVKSQEEVRPSTEVFGSPFAGTPDREETCNSNSGMAIPQLIQPSDLHRRLMLFNLDKARESFTSDSNHEIHKLGGISSEDGDQGTESDSSSDLFEIESACYPLRGDFEDNTSSTQSHYPSTACQLGFPKYFHFGGMEDAITSSAKSCCYESQRTSVNNQKR